MRNKNLIVPIPLEEYRHLAELAKREARLPEAQASVLLRDKLQESIGAGAAVTSPT